MTAGSQCNKKTFSSASQSKCPIFSNGWIRLLCWYIDIVGHSPSLTFFPSHPPLLRSLRLYLCPCAGRLVHRRVRCLLVCVNVFPAPKAMASSRHPMGEATSLSTSLSKCVCVCCEEVCVCGLVDVWSNLGSAVLMRVLQNMERKGQYSETCMSYVVMTNQVRW